MVMLVYVHHVNITCLGPIIREIVFSGLPTHNIIIIKIIHKN